MCLCVFVCVCGRFCVFVCKFVFVMVCVFECVFECWLVFVSVCLCFFCDLSLFECVCV